MSVNSALLAKLSADPGVTKYVPVKNIGPEFDGTNSSLPAICYSRDSIDDEQTHDGPIDRQTAQISIDCLSTSSSQADSIAAAVRTSLNWGEGTWGGTVVDKVRQSGGGSGSFTQPDSQQVIYYATLMFQISYRV